VLVGYAVAITALTFAIVARCARWLRMPSKRRYWVRGWQTPTLRFCVAVQWHPEVGAGPALFAGLVAAARDVARRRAASVPV
jgi:hypothetical protein